MDVFGTDRACQIVHEHADFVFTGYFAICQMGLVILERSAHGRFPIYIWSQRANASKGKEFLEARYLFQLKWFQRPLWSVRDIRHMSGLQGNLGHAGSL